MGDTMERRGACREFATDVIYEAQERPAKVARVAKSLDKPQQSHPVLDITEGVGSESVEDRTAADVMIRMGCEKEEILWALGYIPSPFVAAE